MTLGGRLFLAATVTLGILISALPLETVSSAPMCKLACCAGRAPHAAGSCMNGSCHVDFKALRSSHPRHNVSLPRDEMLCGLPEISRNNKLGVLTMASRLTPNSKPTSNSPDHAKVSIGSTSLTKPCNSDCGSCVTGFSNPSRERNIALLTPATRPRPPTSGALADAASNLALQLNALRRRFPPRGPPRTFS